MCRHRRCRRPLLPIPPTHPLPPGRRRCRHCRPQASCAAAPAAAPAGCRPAAAAVPPRCPRPCCRRPPFWRLSAAAGGAAVRGAGGRVCAHRSTQGRTNRRWARPSARSSGGGRRRGSRRTAAGRLLREGAAAGGTHGWVGWAGCCPAHMRQTRICTEQQPHSAASAACHNASCAGSLPWSLPQAAQRSSWLSGASVTTSDSARIVRERGNIQHSSVRLSFAAHQAPHQGACS